MAENKKPDLEYICPNCGQKAVIGTHFCRTVSLPTSETKKKPSTKTSQQWVYLVAGVLLLVVVLWRWLGPGSLAAASVALLIYLAFSGTNGKNGGSAYRDLVRMCGTEEAADRLVEAELKRSPRSSRRKAVRAALERYQRDLSR
jgi:hypothetical protein